MAGCQPLNAVCKRHRLLCPGINPIICPNTLHMFPSLLHKHPDKIVMVSLLYCYEHAQLPTWMHWWPLHFYETITSSCLECTFCTYIFCTAGSTFSHSRYRYLCRGQALPHIFACWRIKPRGPHAPLVQNTWAHNLLVCSTKPQPREWQTLWYVSPSSDCRGLLVHLNHFLWFVHFCTPITHHLNYLCFQ